MKYLFSIVLCLSLIALMQNASVVESRTKTSKLSAVENDSSPQLFKVTRQKPWTIPGESRFTNLSKTANEQIGAALVQSKTFECAGELPLADIEFYYLRGDGQL